ncbi:MAG: SpoIIE family protein phosphatase [Bacteroidales bacterium]|nr:SpoIIE family protein phosphatase [Bacteroidales bacterium]
MKTFLKITILLVSLISISSNLKSQEIKGLPKIINYYNPDNPYTAEQVWDIKQSPNGLFYLASGKYFLEFDGANFTNLFEDFNSYFLSVDIDTINSKFYIGQKNSISYSKIHNFSYNLEDINIPVSINYCWRTFIVDSSVYYFINNTDVVYYSKNKIELVQRPSNFEIERGFYTDHKLFAVSDNGIAEIIDRKINLLNIMNDSFYKEDIRLMLDYDDKNILVGTKKNNLYLMNKTDYSITLFKNEAENFLKNASIYHGSKLNDTTYIISTLTKGVFIITKTGKLIGHFDQNNGLISSAVYVSIVDKYNNIWLGTGKGISQVYWGNPIRYIDNRLGLNSGIMNFNFFDNKLLISTYAGLLYSKSGVDSWHNDLILTQPSILYASNIVIPQNYSNKYVLISGYDQFQIINNKLEAIQTQKLNSQPVKLHESLVVPNRIFWGTKRGFSVYNLKETSTGIKLVKEKDFFNLSFNIDNLFFDKNNDLWLTHSNSIFFIDFDQHENLNNYKEYFYDTKNGLPNSTISSIFEINDTLYFSTYKGIYQINDTDIQPSNYKFTKSNNILFNGTFNDCIISFLETDKHYFLQGLHTLYKCSKNLKEINQISFKSLFEPFYCNMILKDSCLWLNSKDKIFIIDTANFEKNQNFNYQIGLKSFTVNSKNYSAYLSDSIFEIKDNTYTFLENINNKTTSISLKFFAPYYYNSDYTSYKFFIEEESTEWENAQGNTLLLRQLKSGKYIIRVKAVNYNNVESSEIKIIFNVEKSFFQSVLAFLIYIIIGILILLIVSFFITKKARYKNKSLEEIVQIRTSLLEEQKEELSVQSKELKEQKMLLEREKERLQIALVELKQLSLVAQKTNNSVLIVEQNGKFEWWNRGFTDLFSYKIEKYSNLPLKKAHQKIRPDIFKEIKNYTIDKGTISYTTHEVFDNGEEIWYQTTINPVALTEIDYIKFVVIDYNITSVKTNESEIQKLQELIQLTKNRLNKSIAELKLNKEKSSKIEFFDKKNLEYAKLLKKVTIIENNIQFPNLNYFVIDIPQSELSGDFLWSRQFNKHEIVIIIGDATGHRIRGAINSVITISYLHDLYTLNKDASNEEILSLLNKKLYKTFNTLDSIKDRDHLNIAMLKLNIRNKTINFTSSRLSLFLIRNETENIFYRFDGDRVDLGINNNKKLHTHNIKVKEFDRIYLLTDGWSNQFGKFGLKKYSNTKIRDYLLSIQKDEIYTHQKLIYDEIKNWKGSFEQTDDILIFGAEIKFPISSPEQE